MVSISAALQNESDLVEHQLCFLTALWAETPTVTLFGWDWGTLCAASKYISVSWALSICVFNSSDPFLIHEVQKTPKLVLSSFSSTPCMVKLFVFGSPSAPSEPSKLLSLWEMLPNKTFLEHKVCKKVLSQKLVTPEEASIKIFNKNWNLIQFYLDLAIELEAFLYLFSAIRLTTANSCGCSNVVWLKDFAMLFRDDSLGTSAFPQSEWIPRQFCAGIFHLNLCSFPVFF